MVGSDAILTAILPIRPVRPTRPGRPAIPEPRPREPHTAVLGVVGGGQLARMTALDAARLGIDVRVLAGPSDQGVRGLLTVVDGDHDDPDALRTLARQVDVVTFDHELVPLTVIEEIEEEGRAAVRPGSRTLAFSDKLHQRRTFAAADLPIPAFGEVADLPGVDAFAGEHGWPVVLKAPHGGYDGRGVAVAADLEQARSMVEAAGGQPLLVEPMLDLHMELAVLVVRSTTGEQVLYDAVESVQVDGMCREVIADATHLPADLARRAHDVAVAVAEVVDHVGVLAVELFVVRGEDGPGRILVNEIAPRPHNSGHHTIDGCVTSQFENHARAVLGWPLGSPAPTAPVAVMVNVVGTAADAGGHSTDGHVDPRERVPLVSEDVRIHLYGKAVRAGRKIGHVTATGDDQAEVLRRARRAAAILEGRRPG